MRINGEGDLVEIEDQSEMQMSSEVFSSPTASSSAVMMHSGRSAAANSGALEIPVMEDCSTLDDVSEMDSVYQAWNDMITNENDTLRERVSDLEKKVHEQADEIVCLRSTLADVLRRLNNLEGRGTVAISNHVGAMKDGHATSGQMIQQHTTRRAAPTANTPRRSHYHSNNSLQSDGLSSNSVSPIPSPSPSSMRSSPSPRHTPSPSRAPTHLQISTHSTNNLKKWSSTQDFNATPSHIATQRRTISGSMLNLHVNVKLSSANNSRHGTKEAVYNSEEGYLKMYLRGRPIVMYAPSNCLQDFSLNKVNSLPTERLKLDWIYGYRGRDCRNNLYLLPTGEIVYFIAAVVVLYNVEDQMQRHYLGHTDDVKCLTLHPNKLLVATGQIAGHDRRDNRPHIRVWDSVSLNTMHVIGIGEFERAVTCLAFSKADGGVLLCAVDDASDHNMSIWDWQKGERGHKLVETKCASETVLACEFHPMDRSTIITCGRGHISFWNLEGYTLTKKLGIFEKLEKPKFVLCLAFSETGDVITGDSNGSILIWTRGVNRVFRCLPNVHPGGVFSICTMKDGNTISGGRDGKIVEWDNQYKKTGQIAQLPDSVGPVRTITQGRGSSIIVGTTRNCILQGSFNLTFQTIVQGHTEELWGLAIHPTQNQFITGGHDKTIHLWDTMSHSVVWNKFIGEPVQSACFSPEGSVLIVCTVIGQWVVMNAATREITSTHLDGAEAIDACKFSPDGKFLALGSRDNNIYIYQVSDNYEKLSRIGRCLGHSSFITHLDWSTDSTNIQTTSGDYELLYWNASVCRQIPSSSTLRDVEWSTQTCTLGFNVYGIWPEGCDGSDVNSCDRSHNQKLLATGDDFGKVKLYCYPVSQPKSLCHIYGGHSSHVTAVGFLPDDTRLISLGGRDSSVMQWAVR
uniref:HELP domain-containing protein n=1 Tax=Strigamia maritima TaxID=126957 RepID=T1J5S7_STRMM